MNEELPQAFTDFWDRLGQSGQVRVILTNRDAWLVMAALQYTWRSPGLGDVLREQMWHLGHAFQKLFRDDPYGATLAEQGWQEEYDGPASVTGEANWRV